MCPNLVVWVIMSAELYTMKHDGACRGCPEGIPKGTTCLRVQKDYKTTLHVCAKCVKLAAQQLEEIENERLR